MKHSTASGTSHAVSHKIKISFLKTCSKSISRIKILFLNDTMINGQAFLYIAYKKFV